MDDPVFRDKVSMLQEVRRAHADWRAAYVKLDWVVEKDQIDYAIYALEAAEKRYEMLLRQAKQLGWEDGDLVSSHAQKLHHAEKRWEAREKAKAAGY